MTEIQLTAKCFQWWQNEYGRFDIFQFCLFRIKNELDNKQIGSGLNRMRQLNENQATGVVPGVADFCFLGNRYVAYIELKVGNNKQSAEQKKFEEFCWKNGHQYYLIYSFEEFQKTIQTLIEYV